MNTATTKELIEMSTVDSNNDFVPNDVDYLHKKFIDELKVDFIKANQIEQRTRAQQNCHKWTHFFPRALTR